MLAENQTDSLGDQQQQPQQNNDCRIRHGMLPIKTHQQTNKQTHQLTNKQTH